VSVRLRFKAGITLSCPGLNFSRISHNYRYIIIYFKLSLEVCVYQRIAVWGVHFSIRGKRHVDLLEHFTYLFQIALYWRGSCRIPNLCVFFLHIIRCYRADENNHFIVYINTLLCVFFSAKSKLYTKKWLKTIASALYTIRI
jgi:hypothetical protein